MGRGSTAGSADSGPGDWRARVGDVVDAVQFERQPIDGLDRLMELIVATDALRGGPEAYLSSAREALASTERIAELTPQPHTEGALRKLLVALEGRLEEWVREGAAVTQLELGMWRPEGASTVVAHLKWEPQFLSRWLGVSFDDVPDQLSDARVAVLRLASGRVVALAQIVGNPAPGTSLLQMGSSSPREVVDEFLADSRLSAGVVEWIAAGGPDAG